MLSTIVKISNVTNLSDARYCAGMGVEYLGFTIDEEHPNYVSPARFKEISGWLSGIKIIAETQATDVDSILERIEGYEFDGLQVASIALAETLKTHLDTSFLIRINVDALNPSSLVETLQETDSSIILESDNNIAMTDEWISAIASIQTSTPILLGFGLDTIETIQTCLQTLPIKGIALQGSEELRPGYKDYGMLMDILEALEEDN